MQPIRLIDPSIMDSTRLENWGQVKEPEGAPVASMRGQSVAARFEGMGHLVDMGVWECTPGRWRRQIMLAEYAHFISGQARFFPDQGVPFDIRAGDAVLFPVNTTGVWEITETLRKTYIVIDPSICRPLLRNIGRAARRLTALLRGERLGSKLAS